jgi:hypothetical protein
VLRVFERMLTILAPFRTDLAWGAGLVVGSFIASIVMVVVVVTRLPQDYFLSSRVAASRSESALLRWARCLARNLAGGALIVVGIIMSVPGVPGQGVLTIFIGLLLVDFPGKRKVELWIVRRPRVVRSINSIRKRFSKGPLRIDEPIPK